MILIDIYRSSSKYLLYIFIFINKINIILIKWDGSGNLQ